jgi:hypothetical protein
VGLRAALEPWPPRRAAAWPALRPPAIWSVFAIFSSGKVSLRKLMFTSPIIWPEAVKEAVVSVCTSEVTFTSGVVTRE